MNQNIWAWTIIVMSFIWAAAWIAVTLIKFQSSVYEDVEEEEEE